MLRVETRGGSAKRVPGTGMEDGGWGLSRPGLSCSTIRLPSVLRLAVQPRGMAR